MANILKKLKGPLSTADRKNRNGRIYSRQLWENVLNSEYWRDMMANNSLCGEVVHPGERTESDSFEIDARNVSHRISEAHFEGDKLMGTIEILDTEQGRNLLSLVDSGCIMGISARGMGDLKGDEVDPDTYNFKTFDITFRPSDPNARLIPLEESEKVKMIFTESEQSDMLVEGMYDNPKELVYDKERNDVCRKIINYFNENTLIPELKASFKIHVKVVLNGNNFGNIFVSRVSTEDGTSKFRIFSNKVKGLDTTISADQDIDTLANSFLDRFEDLAKAQLEKEQLQLDLDNKKEGE